VSGLGGGETVAVGVVLLAAGLALAGELPIICLDLATA
jgi:hypothetical protein